MTVLPAVPPLTPKVSVGLLGLLARKVPLVAVKTSKTVVSISVGPITAFNVGGVGGGGGSFPKMVPGTEAKIDPGSAGKSCSGEELSFWMKLIGCTGSCSRAGGVLDPVEPSPFSKVASASCWAACNSAIRAAEFVL